MKALLMMAVAILGMQNASAIDPENWGQEEVNLVRPKLMEKVWKNLPTKVEAELTGKSIINHQIITDVKLGPSKDSLNARTTLLYHVEGQEHPVATRVYSVFCHVHHQSPTEPIVTPEGGLPDPTPEQEFLQSVDCH